MANLSDFGLTSKPVSTRGVTTAPRVDVTSRTYTPAGSSITNVQQSRSFNTVKNGMSQAQVQTLVLQRSTFSGSRYYGAVLVDGTSDSRITGFNTTTSQNLSITSTWSAASTSNAVEIHHFSAYRVISTAA